MTWHWYMWILKIKSMRCGNIIDNFPISTKALVQIPGISQLWKFKPQTKHLCCLSIACCELWYTHLKSHQHILNFPCFHFMFVTFILKFTIWGFLLSQFKIYIENQNILEIMSRMLKIPFIGAYDVIFLLILSDVCIFHFIFFFYLGDLLLPILHLVWRVEMTLTLTIGWTWTSAVLFDFFFTILLTWTELTVTV